ncbi:MAG: transcriptional repressor [Rhodobacteraceae bacterium]|nr:transcriptional repressor [Paracoccaceae bacterium]
MWSGPGSRHIEAAALHASLTNEAVNISLATVYNTLRDFERAGSIRRTAVASERVWFDTDTGDHQHFYIEAESRLIDLPSGWQPHYPMPSPPDGYRITRIDTVVHWEPLF